MTKEEYIEQREFEDKLVEQIFSRPPIEVQMGGKRAMINHIAETAFALFEGKSKKEIE